VSMTRTSAKPVAIVHPSHRRRADSAENPAWLAGEDGLAAARGLASVRAICGAAKFALASSMTKTQSFASGGVKFWGPEVAKVPISVDEPLLGLNHQPFAVFMALVILVMSMVMVAALPLGM